MRNSVTTYIIRLAVAAAAVAWCGDSFAQKHPERRHIRGGNSRYETGEYDLAEERYRMALERAPESFEAQFNLADALYRQERYEEASKLLEELAQNPLLTADQRAAVYHNLGNIMYSRQKLPEAADYYKEALRENPADRETKYNLAYVQKLLDEQSDNEEGSDNEEQNPQDSRNEQGNGDRQDKEGDSEDNGSEGNDEAEEDGNKPSDGQGGEGNEETEKPQGQEDGNGMKREDAESILDAMQQQEDKTRDKVNARKAVGVGSSGKNW